MKGVTKVMLGVCCALTVMISAQLAIAGLPFLRSQGKAIPTWGEGPFRVVIDWMPEKVGGKEKYVIWIGISNDNKEGKQYTMHITKIEANGKDVTQDFKHFDKPKQPKVINPGDGLATMSDPFDPTKVKKIKVCVHVKHTQGHLNPCYTNWVKKAKVIRNAWNSSTEIFHNDSPDRLRCRVWVTPDLPGWYPEVSPDSFTVEPYDSALINFSYYVPGDAVFGNRFVFSWENITYAETTHTEHIAYLNTYLPEGLEVKDTDTLQYQWVYADYCVHVYPYAELILRDVYLELPDYSALWSEEGANLYLHNVTVEPESGKIAYFSFWTGDLRMENVALVNLGTAYIGPGLGFMRGRFGQSSTQVDKLDSKIVIDGLAISNSQEDGLIFVNCVTDTVLGVMVDSASWNGIWFIASKCTLYSCWINGSGYYDLLVTDTSDIYMLSCYFDTGKVQVETGSKLICAWLLSLEAIDGDSIYPDSSQISIFDVDSNLVYSERIEGGLLGPAPLIQYEQTEYGKDFSTPHLVVFSGYWSWGDWDTTFTINVSRDTFITVQAIGPAPAVPTLLEPSDGTITNDSTPTFDWTDVPDATRYHLQVANDTLFESPVIDDSTLTESTYTTAVGLADGFYFWRVRAGKSYLWSDWSPIWSLMIDTEPPTFESTTVWTDTSFGGPYAVTSIVSDYPAGIDSVLLYYRVEPDTGWTIVQMESIGDCNLYSAEIPKVDTVATIDYYLWAIDYATNTATDPEGAPTTFYSFVRLGIAETSSVPPVFALSSNVPNPFNQSTVIRYQLPVRSKVSLKVYDFAGRLVRTLVDEEQEPGYYRVSWNEHDDSGERVAAGIYFYKLKAHSTQQSYTETRKLIVVR